MSTDWLKESIKKSQCSIEVADEMIERCLPKEEIRPMSRGQFRKRVALQSLGGLATSVLIISIVALYLLSSTPSATAAISRALEAYQTADVLKIQQFGENESDAAASTLWVDRTRGARVESANGDVTISDLRAGRVYEWFQKENEVLETEWADKLQIEYYLKWADANERLDILSDLAREYEKQLVLDRVTEDGPFEWRVTFNDPDRKLIHIDLDSEFRIRRTTQWTAEIGKSITLFHYAWDGANADDILSPPDPSIPRVGGKKRDRQLCMRQIKALAAFILSHDNSTEGVQIRALEEIEGLPGFDQQWLLCPKTDQGPFRYIQYPATAWTADQVLLECHNHDAFKVVAIADGHAELLPF